MIRPAVFSDIQKVYGNSLPVTVRAIAVERDGKVVGIAGYAIQRGIAIAFADHDGTLTKRETVLAGRVVMKMLRAFGGPVLALEGPGGGVSLPHFGFTRCELGWRL